MLVHSTKMHGTPNSTWREQWPCQSTTPCTAASSLNCMKCHGSMLLAGTASICNHSKPHFRSHDLFRRMDTKAYVTAAVMPTWIFTAHEYGIDSMRAQSDKDNAQCSQAMLPACWTSCSTMCSSSSKLPKHICITEFNQAMSVLEACCQLAGQAEAPCAHPLQNCRRIPASQNLVTLSMGKGNVAGLLTS